MRRIVLTSLACLVATEFLAVQAPSPSGTVDDPEAYRIYASLLPREWSVTAAHATTLVFQQETATNWHCMPSGKPLETDWREVMENFRAANVSVRLLRAGFPMSPPYIVVPRPDIDATFKSAPDEMMFGWGNFYKKYPDSGGFMMVSVPGFDADRTRAIVYMAHACGSLCGGGTHHLLEKVDGAWREARVPGVQNCVWAS